MGVFNWYRGDGTGDNTGLRRSVAGTTFQDTPWILPTCGYLEDVKALMVGDIYLHWQRVPSERTGTQQIRKSLQAVIALTRGGNQAVRPEATRRRGSPQRSLDALGREATLPLPSLSSLSRDAIIAQFRSLYPSSFDRNAPSPVHPARRYSTTWRDSERNHPVTRARRQTKALHCLERGGEVQEDRR